jgi:hypothetical protein
MRTSQNIWNVGFCQQQSKLSSVGFANFEIGTADLLPRECEMVKIAL